MAKVRMVVMVPMVVEEEFNGFLPALSQWAHLHITRRFPDAVASGHDMGPTEGEYYTKLMECCIVGEPDPLEEMLAPGLVA